MDETFCPFFTFENVYSDTHKEKVLKKKNNHCKTF